MYRRTKFLEELLEIRDQMSRDAFYDVDLFAEHVRSGNQKSNPEKKVSAVVKSSHSHKNSKTKSKK